MNHHLQRQCIKKIIKKLALFSKKIYNRAIHGSPVQPKEDNLLEHLIELEEADYVPVPETGKPGLVPLHKLSPAQILDAQIKTTDWLSEITGEDDTIVSKAQEAKAADAFTALINADPKAQKQLLALEVPEEIRSTVAMVSAYQWKFIEQAEELRSMAVTKIVQETEHPDARIRLKALEMLGKVTEVALFTDRLQIKTEEVSDEELEKRIKEKLGRYMGKADIVDVETKEIQTDANDTKS